MCYWIYLFLTALIFPSQAFANGVYVSEMCNVINIVTGTAGKTFAAFAIISVGIGFFSGKVSWGLLIGVSVGIAAMFGAPSIVSAITGKTSFKCAETTYYGACINGVCPCSTGFTGSTCTECAEGYRGQTCDICASGYNKTGDGSCKKPCNTGSISGITGTSSVSHGTGSIYCNADRYDSSDSISYDCNNGIFTLTNNSSCSCSRNRTGTNCTSCATGYTGSDCNNCSSYYTLYDGSCQQDCPVTGQPGIIDTTVMPGPGTKSCDLLAAGSVNYNCSGGIFLINGSSCNLNPTRIFLSKTVNENGTVGMSTSNGTNWIGVDFAAWGDQTGYSQGSCYFNNSKSVVENLCLGRPTCSIIASNNTFGDPCNGVVKRLHVKLYHY